MHSWFVLAHVLGAFLFVLAHGVSMGAALKLHGERNRDRVTTLLQMSQGAIGIMYIGLVLLLSGGIAAGFSGSFWVARGSGSRSGRSSRSSSRCGRSRPRTT